MTASRHSRWSNLLLGGLLATTTAWGNGLVDPRYHIQGFAAQALISSTNNNFFGDSKDSISTGFTEAGIHGYWQPFDALRLSGQILYRQAGESDEEGLRLDYAQADWQFLRTEATQLGIKLGKVKLPYGLYNKTRDVPFTRPGILLPQSIYLDISRDLLVAAPGLVLHGSMVQGYGAFDYSLGWVRPNFDSEAVEYVILGVNRPGNLEGKETIGARLRWDTPTDTTLMLTYADASADYQPGSSDNLRAGKFEYRNVLASFQQRFDTVTLTAEYSEAQSKLNGFGALLPNSSRVAQTYYFQGEWRFHPAWELMLRYETLYRNKDDKTGLQFQTATGLPAHSMFAKDWALGLRWDVSQNWMLRAEYHHVDGTGWLPGLDNPSFATREQYWNMVLFQAAYRF